VNGIVLITLEDGSMEVLHASDGALLWLRTLDRSSTKAGPGKSFHHVFSKGSTLAVQS
jgi:hypothetical protein